jgi:16S rRNA processing protein RimM
LLEIGRVIKAHGLRGEVVVELVTNRHERVAAGTTLLTDTGPLRILRSSSFASGRGPHSDRWIVAFEGVGDRSAAEALRGRELRAEPLSDPDALWVHELIGTTVIDVHGAVLGVVASVEANPASDLLVLDGGGLVPLRFVVEHRTGVLVVDIPAGLLDDDR